MKENFAAFSNWLVKATLKQKITLGICTVAIVVMAGLGIYQLIPKQSEGLNLADGEATNVTIQAITDSAQAVADKLANTPAETAPVETAAQDTQTTGSVVSNTTTVDTSSTIDEVYIADDGAHYESEPVYSEPTYEESVYEEPASDGGWDGDLGASDASLSEDWQDYGSGISN